MNTESFIFVGKKMPEWKMQKIRSKPFNTPDIELTPALILEDKERPIMLVDIFDQETRKSKTICALIDTGAAFSFISERILKEVALRKISEKIFSLTFDDDKEGEYEIDLIFHKSHHLSVTLNFGKFNPKQDGIDMLIGTDILANFEFIYNSPKKCFSLRFLG